MKRSLFAFMLMLCCGSIPGHADEPRAARSVHLFYKAPEAVVFYNEVTVLEAQNSTYFQVCGFSHGYFGIQQLKSAADKVVLFSVWDPGTQNDPNNVAAEHRVNVLYHDPQVEVKRFGGEGTGAQSFLHYTWKVGETYKFALRAEVKGERTAYAAFFYRNDLKKWQHLATFDTLAHGDALKGYYSFIEDFRRDGQSPQERRRAVYGNGWVQTGDSAWIALTQATFTADQTPLNNINAAVQGNGFLLETGGDTKTVNPLHKVLKRDPVELPLWEP